MEWTALITTKQSLMQSPTGARSNKMEKKRRMPKKGSISVKSDSNRMEELLDCFAFKKVPTVERARKRDLRKESKDSREEAKVAQRYSLWRESALLSSFVHNEW